MGQDIDVQITVENHELSDRQGLVLDEYERNIATFIRKEEDYGGSFEKSALIESILRHGTIREDKLPKLISKQIFVRGFMDKISRFYQLAFVSDEQLVNDESLIDSVLDLGNYAHMLAALLRKYDE